MRTTTPNFYARVSPVLDALKSAEIASLVIAHPAKSGALSARGAGAQEDVADVVLNLTVHKGEVTDADAIIKLSVTKHRILGLGIAPFYLRRLGCDLFDAVDPSAAAQEYAAAQATGPTRKGECKEAIIEHLEECQRNANGTEPARARRKDIEEGMTALGFSVATFDRAFRELKDRGDIVRHKDGYNLRNHVAEVKVGPRLPSV